MNEKSMNKSQQISIGQLADRTGLTVSAIRFYETQGLVSSTRNESYLKFMYKPAGPTPSLLR